MRHRSFAAALVVSGAAACREGTGASGGRLVVTPERIACTAGDRVELAASVDGRDAPATFTVRGEGAWLTRVARDRGSATLTCEAEGRGAVLVEGAGQQLSVDVRVAPPPASTLRVTLSPATLSLVNGNAAPLSAVVSSTREGVSTAPRFYSTDPDVATVDSIFGLVTATGPGTVAIVAAARANRDVRETATVSVVRGSDFAVGLALSPGAFSLLVGDSARVVVGVQLAPTAPPETTRAIRYSTDDPLVAVVSPDGVVRGVGPGTTSVVAAAVAAPRLTGRVPVTVRVPPP